MTGAAGAEALDETAPELYGIMIVSLPDEADGILTYGGHAMLTGESVPAEHLDELAYEPVGSMEASYAYVPVYQDGSIGEETVCDVGAQVNVRPTAENAELSTYRNLTVGGIFPVTEDVYKRQPIRSSALPGAAGLSASCKRRFKLTVPASCFFEGAMT